MTFGNSRARAISLEYKNTMFKYIYTLKCGGKKNIYFTEHDIYFTKLMFILKNINLELKSALRTKYIFYRILLYQLSKPPTVMNTSIEKEERSHSASKLVQTCFNVSSDKWRAIIKLHCMQSS